MDTSRKTAIFVGVLYIIGTISGVLSVVFTRPIREDPDYLINVSANENQVIIGVLFVLLMGLALADGSEPKNTLRTEARQYEQIKNKEGYLNESDCIHRIRIAGCS